MELRCCSSAGEQARRIRSFQDTIAAPGQTSLFLLAGSAIGGQIGSGFVIGGAEYGARYGIAGAWYGIGCGLSYFITAALCRFIRTHHYVSPADYFARRYSGHAPRMIYTAASISCSVSLLAGQLLAGRADIPDIGPSGPVGCRPDCGYRAGILKRRGLWGSMAVSSIQSVIIFIGMSTALFLMMSAPGPGVLAAALPASSFHLAPFGAEFLVSMTAPIVLASSVNQISFQSAASAKSLKSARGGYLLAGLTLIPVAFIPPLLGMYGRTLFPGIPAENVFSSLLLTRLPTAVAAVILAAVICAVVSSCNSAYIAVAANFVHDIYLGMVKSRSRQTEPAGALMLLADMAVCCIGILLALKMNDIIRVLSMGYSLMASGCLVPFLGGVIWKKGTSRGALYSAFAGMAVSLAASLELIRLPYASISSILISAAVYAAVSLLAPEKNG